MERLLIVGLALLGMASKAGPAPPPAIDWIMWLLCAGFMLVMGARLDDALRRWEMKPHWRKVERSSVTEIERKG
jgi:hypothetical protein